MLEGIIVKVLISLISMIGGWLVKHFQQAQKDRADEVADQKKTSDADKELQEAKNKEDLENAAKDIAGNFGKHP